jgi:aminopeptidase
MKNVLFDEKISGTVHLALGRSYASTGGVNQSLIHWDMVKDLRNGGRLYLDGELVQENGDWLEPVSSAS